MDRFVRWAALIGFPELARSVGLDPERLLANVGLRMGELADQDKWMPAAPVALVLEQAAAESGRDDFAVRLNRWRPFSGLGPIGLVLREEPDLRSALDLLIRYQKAYNGVIDLRATGRLLLPPWPGRLTAFHQVFGVALRFDHEFTGVVFPARDLDAATVTADPGLRPYARQFLQALPAPRAETLTAEVRSLVEFLLPLGRCSMVHVSRDLGMQPRTLHRRLIADGTTGPTGTLAAALAPAAVRASGLGVLALAYNLLGLFTGPLIIGLLADRLGLTTAMRLAPAVSLAAIGVLAAGRLAYPGSIRRIEARPRCRRTGHPVGRGGPRRAQRACFGSPPWTVIA